VPELQRYEDERREAAPQSKREAAPPSAARNAAPAAAEGYASGAAADSVNNLGTEYGETRQSQVEDVQFVRASSNTPAYVAVLHYDDADGLIARGIELTPPRVSRIEPQAFPRNRFAPPPP
jgi:hypothetical protein